MVYILCGGICSNSIPNILEFHSIGILVSIKFRIPGAVTILFLILILMVVVIILDSIVYGYEIQIGLKLKSRGHIKQNKKEDSTYSLLVKSVLFMIGNGNDFIYLFSIEFAKEMKLVSLPIALFAKMSFPFESHISIISIPADGPDGCPTA